VNISPDGIRWIVQREGVVLTMYRDSAGLPTIGCGHLLTKDELSSGKLSIWGVPVRWRDGLTPQQANDLLDRDLDVAELAVDIAVHVPLAEYQFDALVSLCFNIGDHAFADSTLVRLLNAAIAAPVGTGEDTADIPAQFRRWIHSAGRVDPILVRRREDEIRQWEAI
jgi:lysozyme